MARAIHECIAWVAARVIGVASRRQIVFADCSEFRAGLVRFFPLSDRSFFNGGHGWRRNSSLFLRQHGLWFAGGITPTWKGTFGLGLLLGLLLLAKFSTAPMFVLALLWMLLLGTDEVFKTPARWNWGKTAAALLLALLVVWAGYFFHVSRLTVRDGTLTATFPNWSEPIIKQVHGRRKLQRPHSGRRVRRRFSRTGEAQPAGAGRVLSGTSFHSRWMEIVLPDCDPAEVADNCFGLVVNRLCDRGQRKKIRVPPDLGSWHHFPRSTWRWRSLHVSISETVTCCPCIPSPSCSRRQSGSGRDSKPTAVAVLMLLAALNAADAMRFAPGYLSSFTPFVRSTESYRLLTDSNLDWGQGLLALRDYQLNHPGEPIALSYFGSIDPRLYGIQSNELEVRHVAGTYSCERNQCFGTVPG